MFQLARHSAFTPQDIQKMMGFSVGFDSVFDRFFDMDNREQGYPPYNIRKVNDIQYVIELALAGFSKDDIEVELTDGQLAIRSKDKKEEEEDSDSFVHKGIARRSFSRTYTLSDDVIVKGADLKDGMLIINLERVIPDEKKPRLIQIST